MIIQNHFTRLHQSILFGIAVLAGLGGIIIGCGGGGNGVSTIAAGDGDTPPAVNQGPMATISSPSGSFFNEGENITFTGMSTDAEDGQVDDSAFVWTSSIDGSIGTGSTLITSALTPGDHDISLSVTDSSGAVYETDPILIHVEPTRFLKMGRQTTGVTDASTAFDGNLDTAATISTAVADVIYIQSYIGGADTFIFCIKLGASEIGTKLVIEGLTVDDFWWPVSEIDVNADRTVTVKVTDAQVYKAGDGYINLRAFLVNAHGPDAVSIYEFWRVDPFYAGSETIGVDNADLAFDGDPSTAASITDPSISTNSSNFLHFKAYVGWRESETLTLNVFLNSIGSGHYLKLYVDDVKSGTLNFIEDLSLDTAEARAVTIQDAQNYLDGDGFINLRAYWLGLKTPGTAVEVYEIRRIDPFFVGHKTSFKWVANPESAVDGDLNSYSIIYYFWGELDHKDFLHVQTYLGDASSVTFSFITAPSAPGAEMIIDGEYEPDNWSVIERISLDDFTTTKIDLLNAREFVNADGYLSLRFRWESNSMSHDAYIYEIWREED